MEKQGLMENRCPGPDILGALDAAREFVLEEAKGPEDQAARPSLEQVSVIQQSEHVQLRPHAISPR